MSTDVQRLSDAMPLIHEVWACPLEIALAIWLLVKELGLATFGPVIVLILAVTLVSIVAARMASAQKDWFSRHTDSHQRDSKVSTNDEEHQNAWSSSNNMSHNRRPQNLRGHALPPLKILDGLFGHLRQCDGYFCTRIRIHSFRCYIALQWPTIDDKFGIYHHVTHLTVG